MLSDIVLGFVISVGITLLSISISLGICALVMDWLDTKESIRYFVLGVVSMAVVAYIVIPLAKHAVKESHENAQRNESSRYQMIEDDVMDYLSDNDYYYEMDDVDCIVKDIINNKQYNYFEDIIISDENYLEKSVKSYFRDKEQREKPLRVSYISGYITVFYQESYTYHIDPYCSDKAVPVSAEEVFSSINTPLFCQRCISIKQRVAISDSLRKYKNLQ